MSGVATAPYPLLGTFAYRTLLAAFALFVIVAWMPRVTTVGGDIGIGAVLLAIMASLMLFAPKRARLDRQAEGCRFAILLGAGFLLLWGYLGIFRLDDPFRAGRLILSVGQGVILVFVISQVLSVRALRLSLFLAGAGLVGTSLLSLYNYLGGPPISLTILVAGYDRSSGLFKNPNQYGMVLAMGVPFAVALYFRCGSRAWALLLGGSAFVGLVLAASKTNLALGVLLLLATTSYMLLSRGRIRTLLVALPLMSSVALFGGMALLELFNPRAAAIIADLVVGSGVGESATVVQRMDMWLHSLDELRRSPLFGQGTGQLIDTTTQVHSHSHNMFIDLARTTGIPGLAGALLFVLVSCWLAVRTLLRLARLPAPLLQASTGAPAVIGACFAIFSYVASNQMSDSFGPSTSVFFWLCVGLVLRRDDLLHADETGARRGDGDPRERIASARNGDGAERGERLRRHRGIDRPDQPLPADSAER